MFTNVSLVSREEAGFTNVSLVSREEAVFTNVSLVSREEAGFTNASEDNLLGYIDHFLAEKMQASLLDNNKNKKTNKCFYC